MTMGVAAPVIAVASKVGAAVSAVNSVKAAFAKKPKQNGLQTAQDERLREEEYNALNQQRSNANRIATGLANHIEALKSTSTGYVRENRGRIERAYTKEASKVSDFVDVKAEQQLSR
jgi:hypothetical protein